MTQPTTAAPASTPARTGDGKRPADLRWIALGYAVALLFLAVFVITVARGNSVATGLGEPRWALLIAVVLVVPVLAPTIARTVGPRLRMVKIGDLAEFQFAGAEARAFTLDALVGHLQPASASAELSAPEYASMMTSLSYEITSTVARLELTREEVLVVDLRDGHSWVLPNLYFLTLLTRRRTAVRQIAFVETQQVEEAFVCMCSPDELLESMDRAHPILRQAADTVTYESLMSSNPNAGAQFFGRLQALYAAQGAANQPKEPGLTSTAIYALLGKHAHRDAIEWREPAPEAAWRTVLGSSHPYTAALEGWALLSLLSRDRMALIVAREVARRSSA
jgi:hypothetical protein